MKAVVTGASSGIGRDIARELAQLGYDLVLVARREERLRELAASLPVRCQIIAMDLSSAENCRALYRQLSDEDIAVLVNNAGFGKFGRFDESDLDTDLRMIDLNVRAVHILTRLFLEKFEAQDMGYILNVASSAAFLPGPLMATYYATKAYVLRLTQAIHEELRRHNSQVRVAALCPGPVDTEFNTVANVRFSLRGLGSRRVAHIAVRGLFGGKLTIVPGTLMKLGTAVTRLVPTGALLRAAYHIQHRKQSKGGR